MRDVFDGLVELSLESAYSTQENDFQIIDISPPSPFQKRRSRKPSKQARDESAEIIAFPKCAMN